MTKKNNIIQFPSEYYAHETSFGSYVTQGSSRIIRVFFRDGQELDVSNMNVIIHDNGIEFLED